MGVARRRRREGADQRAQDEGVGVADTAVTADASAPAPDAADDPGVTAVHGVTHGPARGGVSELWAHGVGRAGTRSLQVLAIVALVAVAVFAVTRLTLIVIPVLIALVLAAAISPLVVLLRRKGVPSFLATVIALLALVALLTLVVWLVAAAVVNQWPQLRDQGILVRWFPDPRVRDHLRISIGTDAEMDALIEAMRGILGNTRLPAGPKSGKKRRCT